MIMRVAVGIHKEDIDSAIITYDLMSKMMFTHATPTLFNAGTPRPQLASCFLVAMKDDSIGGIYDTLKSCAQISKYAGGIGLHIHNIRAKNSYINGTNGTSNGILPMLKVFNDTARYVDQGGGKRNGSIAIYLEPWHADIMEFLELKKNHGNELEKARDLFYGLWIPDLFMKRVQENGKWSLFCPDECKGLSDCYGKATDREILDQTENAFKEQGFRVSINQPFSGGFITKHYGDPILNQDAIQIEINRSLYMNELKIEKADSFDDFKKVISEVFKKLAYIGQESIKLAAE